MKGENEVYGDKMEPRILWRKLGRKEFRGNQAGQYETLKAHEMIMKTQASLATLNEYLTPVLWTFCLALSSILASCLQQTQYHF